MVHVISFRKLLYLVAHNRHRVQVSIVLRTELCFMGIDTILKWGDCKNCVQSAPKIIYLNDIKHPFAIFRHVEFVSN